MSDLKGKVALITGASSGLGAATAKLFASLGAKLSLTGRNEANLKLVVDECKCVGPADAEPPLMVLGDVCSESDVAKLVDATTKKFGRLDILVNNAGIFALDTIQNTSLENFDRMMNTNLRSVFQLTMLCVPHLIETRGNIVNVSSITGTRAINGMVSYCMSKAAMDQMTSCIALELAPKGVRVNSINPGVIVTEIHKRGGMSEDDYAKFLQIAKERQPLGRVGDPEEVAQAIAFLASSNASFITGEHVHTDGGLHTACWR